MSRKHPSLAELAEQLLGPSHVLWPTFGKGQVTPVAIYVELGESSNLSLDQKKDLVHRLSRCVDQMDNAVLDFIDLCRGPQRRRKRVNAIECLEFILSCSRTLTSHALVLGYPKLSWLLGVKSQLEALLAHLDDHIRSNYRKLLAVARRLHKSLLATAFDLDELELKLSASTVS